MVTVVDVAVIASAPLLTNDGDVSDTFVKLDVADYYLLFFSRHSINKICVCMVAVFMSCTMVMDPSEERASLSNVCHPGGCYTYK
jgi:exosome complex RNA-binding protein Rrp42 (RNase PH superfamily)